MKNVHWNRWSIFCVFVCQYFISNLLSRAFVAVVVTSVSGWISLRSLVVVSLFRIGIIVEYKCYFFLILSLFCYILGVKYCRLAKTVWFTNYSSIFGFSTVSIVCFVVGRRTRNYSRVFFFWSFKRNIHFQSTRYHLCRENEARKFLCIQFIRPAAVRERKKKELNEFDCIVLNKKNRTWTEMYISARRVERIKKAHTQ